MFFSSILLHVVGLNPYTLVLLQGMQDWQQMGNLMPNALEEAGRKGAGAGLQRVQRVQDARFPILFIYLALPVISCAY